MMHILVVLGTRPEAIKLAPVILELQRRGAAVECQVCASGQHRDLVHPILADFGIGIDQDLAVGEPNQTPTGVLARILERLEPVLAAGPVDWLLAQGDTMTALAATLAGGLARVPVGHIEAGLRTGRRDIPFPEELCRRLADTAADILFAPTESARANLLREGIEPARIIVTGNTVVDSVLMAAAREPIFVDPRLAGLRGRVVLVTVHRRESFGADLAAILRAVARLAREFRDVTFVFPVHPNPNVRQPAAEILGGLGNVVLTEPLEYVPFVHLMKRSELVLSDSGGVQEEAPSVGVQVLVLRNATERSEAVESGWAQLVGVDEPHIFEAALERLRQPSAFPAPLGPNPFGDGQAAWRIVDALQKRRIRVVQGK